MFVIYKVTFARGGNRPLITKIASGIETEFEASTVVAMHMTTIK